MLLQTRRKELKLTQKQVAKKLGLTRGRIGQFEGGAVIPEKYVGPLADLLDLNKSSLRSDLRPVRKRSELKEWKRMIFDDHQPHSVIRTTLVWMADFLLEDGLYRYNGTIERLAAATPGVELAELHEHWDAMLDTGYVQQLDPDNPTPLGLTFPS